MDRRNSGALCRSDGARLSLTEREERLIRSSMRFALRFVHEATSAGFIYDGVADRRALRGLLAFLGGRAHDDLAVAARVTTSSSRGHEGRSVTEDECEGQA